jgi:hypothetical protein
MATTPGHLPRLFAEEDAPALIRERIEYIGEQICRNPVLYGITLAQLGEDATRYSVQYSADVEVASSIGSSPASLLKEFFTQRYDSFSDFDQPTKQRIESSAMYRQLKDNAMNKRPQLIKTGVMSSELRSHPQSIASRDRFRRYRLATFIELTRQYVATQPFSPGQNSDRLAS